MSTTLTLFRAVRAQYERGRIPSVDDLLEVERRIETLERSLITLESATELTISAAAAGFTDAPKIVRTIDDEGIWFNRVLFIDPAGAFVTLAFPDGGMDFSLTTGIGGDGSRIAPWDLDVLREVATHAAKLIADLKAQG